MCFQSKSPHDFMSRFDWFELSRVSYRTPILWKITGTIALTRFVGMLEFILGALRDAKLATRA